MKELTRQLERILKTTASKAIYWSEKYKLLVCDYYQPNGQLLKGKDFDAFKMAKLVDIRFDLSEVNDSKRLVLDSYINSLIDVAGSNENIFLLAGEKMIENEELNKMAEENYSINSEREKVVTKIKRFYNNNDERVADDGKVVQKYARHFNYENEDGDLEKQ